MSGTPRLELLQVADAVAREKSIDREEVLVAMEQAIQKAGRSKYGLEHDIRAEVSRKNGEITLARYREVVADDAEIEDENIQLPHREAVVIQEGVEIGEFLIDPLPPIDFGRIAAQTAKQVIVQQVRGAERARQYEEYKDRAGEIVNGIVKRVEYGNVIIDLGRAEGYMRRDETIMREFFKNGDRVRAYIFDVREEQRGPQIFLSRTHPEFMAKLFAQEVPEIYDGVIEIKAVARDPGSRAKIAVISNDSSIDPVGACVGMRGSRVQAVVGELQGEKIDIIPWTQDAATFLVNALAPAEVSKVVMDEETGRVEVVVPEEQLKQAIGRRGQNVRLASMLTGWDIDIITEEDEAARFQEMMKKRTEIFIEALDCDEMLASLLVTEGFASLEDIAQSPVDELTGIQGIEEELGAELQQRAANFIEKRDAEFEARRVELGVEDQLAEIGGMTPEMMVKLGENEVRSLEDIAYLAGDEFVEIVGEEAITEDSANAIIMALRSQLFEEEWQAADEAAAEAEAAEAEGEEAEKATA
ncbi:MAG: transcription termination/antitermination protein NusA [Alphaproteobacteria bacterium]|nr:transcription termination/antitermination protein NusA [Alphaproteobacteria bacterium SS10]